MSTPPAGVVKNFEARKQHSAQENGDQQPGNPSKESSPISTALTQGSPLFLPPPIKELVPFHKDVVERDNIQVQVPPVHQRWEYRCYEEEPTNARGVGTSSPTRKKYQVPTRSSRSSSSERVVRRSSRKVRPRKANCGDATDPILSSDDELTAANASKFPNARKRSLLSNPKNRHAPLGSVLSDSLSEDDNASRRGRKGRSNGKGRMSYADSIPVDDEEEDSETYEIKLGKRKRRGQTHLEGGKRRKTSLDSQYTDKQPVEGTRRSGRVMRTLGGMREIGEDDVPYTNDFGDSNAAPKFTGAKETYKELPHDSEFRLRHSQTCDVCREVGENDEKGQLVYCQGCTLSYHQKCLGNRNAREHLVTKIGDDEFVLQCRRCIGIPQKKDPLAPEQGSCVICHEKGRSCEGFRERKSSRQEQKDREDNDGNDPIEEVSPDLINNARNVLFRCTKCYRTYHLHHLPARTDTPSTTDDDQEQLESDRFEEYSQDWSCQDCADPEVGIDTIVAWRPIDQEKYGPETPTDMVPEDEKEYLVKFKKMSYFRALWRPGPWVWGVTHVSMRKAFAKRDMGYNLAKLTTEEAIPEECLRVDIILDVEFLNDAKVQSREKYMERIKEVKTALVKYKGLGYEDVVWEEPPDTTDADRWEDFKSAYEEWVIGKYVHLPALRDLESHLKKIRELNFENKVMVKEQPEYLSGGKLMEYQMEGLNWLYYRWHQRQNAILADEMGLGKTIQVIAFLAALQQKHKCWPFLIIVPNSTCPNWRREIKRWAPSLRVVAYYGVAEARRLIDKHELFPHGNKDLGCHVVVTSYEAAQHEEFRKTFRGISWQGLIVDEGQRLKNDKNMLYEALNNLKSPFKVLLTGTPLQNNPRELFNLLQFLDKSFDAEAMEAEYAILTKENVPQLHELLRKLILRRTKAQVLKFLPAMAQIIIPVTMSVLQKKLYRSIIAKNSDLIKSIFGGSQRATHKIDRANLNNILMQLRKCLCHPFVYSRAIEEKSSDAATAHRNLVEASGKLKLLEIMLPKLHELGHRVLIFSQFLDMLDIIEDFLDGLGLTHERLDGRVSSLMKQKRIDEFNAPDSPLFAFLLSTRAGGVGINLATADTVLILDPDFNPHQDIQALSRAHRIGQQKKVLVFQLTTRGSAEEKIMQIGKKKMALDHALIEQMGAAEDDAGMDLESILRHGAEALFQDDDAHDINYDSASLDKLLDRSQIENTQTGNDNSAESQFSFARVWANDKASLEDTLDDSTEADSTIDPSTWENILKIREQEAAAEAALKSQTFGRGRRKRQSIDYTKQTLHDSPERKTHRSQSDSDTDFQAHSDKEESGEEVVLDKDENFALSEELEQAPPLLLDQPKSSPIKCGEREERGERGERGEREARTFKHLELPLTPQEPSRMVETSGNARGRGCLACGGFHARGACPLKLAGADKCGLCGIAHYGSAGRVCPHFHSMTQCRAMMDALRMSKEPKADVDLAKKYLSGVIGGLQRKRKQKSETQVRADVEVVQAPPASVGRKINKHYSGQGNVMEQFTNGMIGP